MKRVVVTGVGPVSSVGIGRQSFWTGLQEGCSGVTPFDVAGPTHTRRMAARIEPFNVADYLETVKTYLDRTSQLAFAAFSLALEEANLSPTDPAVKAGGLSLGTAYGPLATEHLFFSDFHRKGPRLVKPILFPHAYSNTPISLLAMEYGMTGYHLHNASGWIASTLALALAVQAIQEGHATLMVAGGFEAFHPILFQALDQENRLARDEGDGEVARPYDRRRNGFVAGEGAGLVVLEEEQTARARKAPLLARLTGFGAAWGPAARCTALQQAAGAWQEGDLIIGHANGSREEDRREALAICEWSGGTAKVPVAILGGRVGESFGATGALQTIAAVEMLDRGTTIPLTLQVPDPECPVAPATGKERPRRVLVLSADPGGAAAALALERSEDELLA